MDTAGVFLSSEFSRIESFNDLDLKNVEIAFIYGSACRYAKNVGLLGDVEKLSCVCFLNWYFSIG